MTLRQADKQCIFSGGSLHKQIMKANCSLCAACLCSVVMLQIFVKQTTKANKHNQTIHDPLLKKIFLEDDYREIVSFYGCFTVTDTLNELRLAKYNVGKTAWHLAVGGAMYLY
jgi:hypothetical protein